MHALPLPGQTPGNIDERYVLLPSKRFVYRKYEEACQKSQDKVITRRKFESLWLPYIVTAKPATDLCFTCQQNTRLIAKPVNLPEHLKTDRIQKAQQQLDRAHKEREFYGQQCQRGASFWDKFQAGNTLVLEEMHYSYDYAQQLHYPLMRNRRVQCILRQRVSVICLECAASLAPFKLTT